jgi:hypothetical protein
MDLRLRGFILFCIERRGRQWPGLYDEMAKVASGRLYEDMGYADLRKLGLSLGLDGLEKTRLMVNEALGMQGVPASDSEQDGRFEGEVTAKLAHGY